jgi:anti-sigma regulatory factor (Ser/Thr protein kinase)
LLLTPDPYAPAVARRKLKRSLGGLPEDVLDDVLLLTTEVVTNSVRHAPAAPGDVICVDVHVDDGHIRVEVRDRGRGAPFVDRDAGPHDDGGRGLMLVRRLADRWGVKRDQATSVWFELDISSPRPRAG